MSEVTITVRGEHEARVAPEEAVAHLSVRAEGPERGAVVERIAALAAPLREVLENRKSAGTISEWSSQRVSVWSYSLRVSEAAVTSLNRGVHLLTRPAVAERDL